MREVLQLILSGKSHGKSGKTPESDGKSGFTNYFTWKSPNQTKEGVDASQIASYNCVQEALVNRIKAVLLPMQLRLAYMLCADYGLMEEGGEYVQEAL
jgi:hypothetical protein